MLVLLPAAVHSAYASCPGGGHVFWFEVHIMLGLHVKSTSVLGHQHLEIRTRVFWHCRRATKGRRKGKSSNNYPAKRLTRDEDDNDAISGTSAEVSVQSALLFCHSYLRNAILLFSETCLQSCCCQCKFTSSLLQQLPMRLELVIHAQKATLTFSGFVVTEYFVLNAGMTDTHC